MKIQAATRLAASNVDQAELAASALFADVKLDADQEDAFQELVKTVLVPGVEQARKQLNEVAKQAAGKMRAWAMVHYSQAKQLGRDTSLFEKILHDPVAAATQLLNQLMGLTKDKSSQQKKLDDVLDGLAF